MLSDKLKFATEALESALDDVRREQKKVRKLETELQMVCDQLAAGNDTIMHIREIATEGQMAAETRLQRISQAAALRQHELEKFLKDDK
ncbi:MAG: hypothetical protein HQ592_18580 [Planctomycetes bacterium]|nr:hypothetical protein [Planctomycetota bacterium]